jgi:uncharacterized protein
MESTQLDEVRRIFTTRLDSLAHILSVGHKHLPDMNAALQERLAPDMLTLGTQVAFACNQPRGFARWCAGQDDQNLDPDVTTLEAAQGHIRDTQALLAGIHASDSKLDEIKRTDLRPGLYCEMPARLYVSDFLIPNFYFHISMTYAILRKLGVPLGKADYMGFLMPHLRQQA